MGEEEFPDAGCLWTGDRKGGPVGGEGFPWGGPDVVGRTEGVFFTVVGNANRNEETQKNGVRRGLQA